MSFFKNGEQEGKTGLVWGLSVVCGGRIWWNYYILRYENRNMRPVETILGMEGEGRNKGK
jgi:hypothetical protein